MTATKIRTAQLADETTNYGIVRQAIINGGCVVSQRANTVLSTSVVYGAVDRIYAIAEGTVGAGSINQETAAGLTFDYAVILTGVTLTGAGKAKIGYRMEAKDAKMFKNGTASFSVRVYHNVGSAKTYTIYVNKANSADNFSAVTAISNDGGESVANTTETLLKYENISLGDCSNGIEIIVECNSGAITGKNLYFAELQFNAGSVALPFQPKLVAEELLLCKRYCHAINSTAIVEAIAQGNARSTTVAQILIPLPVEMRTSPTITATAGDYQLYDGITAASDVTAIAKDDALTTGETMFGIKATVASGLTQFRPYYLISDGTAGRLIIITAEL